MNQTFVERYENISSPEYLFMATGPENWMPLYERSRNPVLSQLQESALASELDRLDNEDCIQSYGKMYLSNRSNLLLVGSAPLITLRNGTNISLLTINDTTLIPSKFVSNEVIDKPEPPMNCAVDPVSWMCDGSCDVACVNSLNELEPQNWNVEAYEATDDGGVGFGLSSFAVDYCLSQPTKEACKLQFSLPIAIVIISFNFSKAVIMLILAFGLGEARVQTIGDAVASFLIQPDHIVNSRCLYCASDFEHVGLSGKPRNLIFTNKSIRFAKTGEKRVWLLTYIL